MIKKNIYTIAQVNKYIKTMFTQDFMLRHICLKGEVSNCKYHTSGHIYFTMKDESSSINVVMFAGNRGGLKFRMKNGDKVIVTGSIEVYERDGKYQLYAREIELDGIGQLYQRFLELKREMEEMGMFAQEYKQPIPRFVSKVGIVTAPTGAAIQDIRNIAGRRNPYVQLVLYPALVQGEGAAQSIVNGIEAFNKTDVDVIIVGRGGGSIEDLWAFNEEIVARAIFNSELPIISAVGHEIDFTISDYVADMRAPTPSAAAELAVYDIRQFYQQLAGKELLLNKYMQRIIIEKREELSRYILNMKYLNPRTQLNEKRKRVADLEEKIKTLMESKLVNEKHRLAMAAQTLEGLSPLKKLQQGYSHVASSDGRTITSIEQVKKNDELAIHVKDGLIRAVVKSIDE